MSNGGKDLHLDIDARVLKPDATTNPHAAPGAWRNWYGLPSAAVIRWGELPTAGRYQLKRATICGGALTEIDLKYRPTPVQNFLEDLAVPPGDRPAYRFYTSNDRKWFSRCGIDLSTCDNRFLNGLWAAQLIVGNEDLCRSSEMNNRLVQIVDRWTKLEN